MESLQSERPFNTEKALNNFILSIKYSMGSSNEAEVDAKNNIIKTNLQKSLDTVIVSLLPELKEDVNENTAWQFMFRVNTRVEENDNHVIASLRLLALMDIICIEVKIAGLISSAEQEVASIRDDLLNILNGETRQLNAYYELVNDYKSFWQVSIAQHRLKMRLEGVKKEEIENRFKEIQEQKEAFDTKYKEKFEKIFEEYEKNFNLLQEIRDKSSFTALYNGFNNYAVQLRFSKKKSLIEKYIVIFLLVLVPVAGTSLCYLFENYYAFLPAISIFILCGLLLKVCLKRIDQIDQVIVKVEHKLAVSAFYENRVNKMQDGKEKELAQQEYYSFIFSRMETREWNAPDMTDNIVALIKAIKSK